MKHQWLSLGLTFALGCGGTAPQGGDLLKDLRQKHQQQTGEPAQPHDAAHLKAPHTAQHAKTSADERSEQEGRALDEVTLITPGMLEKDYPSRAYITGVGYTETVDLRQAIVNAKEQVAASISSKIESKLTVELSAGRATRNDSMETRSSSRSKQTTTQTVLFEHAELIEVDPKRTGCDEERCVAVAYLARARLAAGSLERFKPLAERFKRACSKAIKSAQRQRVSSFASDFATIEKLYAQLTPLGLGLTVILSAEGFPDWARLQKERLKVQALRDELMSDQPVIVDVTGLDDPKLAGVLSEELRASLLALGAEARPFFGGPSACAGQPAQALHLKVSGVIQKQRLMGKQFYILPYKTTVTQCRTLAVIARYEQVVKFDAPQANRTLEEVLRQKLAKSQVKSTEKLYKSLHLTLPLFKPFTGEK